MLTIQMMQNTSKEEKTTVKWNRIVSFFLLSACALMAQVQVPYELIENKTPYVYNQDDAEFANCMTQITPSNMETDVALHDSLQIYGDCQNINMSPFRVNQAGYLPDGPKTFYYVGGGTGFQVIDPEGNEVASGTFSGTAGTMTAPEISMRASNNAILETGGDTRYTASGTGAGGAIQVGTIPDGLDPNTRYRIKVGSDVSPDFIVNEKVYSMVKDAVIKYFGIARAGDSESWFHPPAHLQDGVQGGWYDCGDHLKESITQSFAASVLGAMAAVYQDRDTDKYAYNHGNYVNTDGVGDVLREARHGVDYIIESYNQAGGTVSSMITSVGNFGNDHNWWGSPEFQDGVPEVRGGPVRELRNEVWSTVTGRFAAAAAFVAKLYEPIDATYSASALQVARDLYAHGKAAAGGAGAFGSSPAYNGEQTFDDDMALAAVALAWATGEQTYYDDLVNNTALGTKDAANGSVFTAGWFAAGSADNFTHHQANTSWSSMHPVPLWAFYKLILRNSDMWDTFGIDAAQAREYSQGVAMLIAFNMDQVDGLTGGGGSSSISVPVPRSPFAGYMTGSDGQITYDPTWYARGTEQDWIWNRYQFGNIAESFFYWDVAHELAANGVPPYNVVPPSASTGWEVGKEDGSVSDWNQDEVYNLLINQMDYMLGKNPWELSMIQGIGDKNSMHVHHRAANPEGKNVPGAFYQYRIPVGGLTAGYSPGAAWDEHYDDFHYMEVCLDGATVAIIPSFGLADTEDLGAPPDVSVQIEYVGFDKAIVTVNQSAFGTSEIHYGTSETSRTTIEGPSNAGVVHQFTLENLDPSTTYYFTAVSKNSRSLAQTERFLVDSASTPYSFTTLSTPPASAQIQNVKVCNVTSDSAEVMWFTPNGQYGSEVHWDEAPALYGSMTNNYTSMDPPSKFHIVKFGGLEEKTTYNFAVESDGEVKSVDASGQPFSFTTPVEHVAFDIRTHTYDANGTDDAFSIVMVNQDSKTYDSIEARVYMRAPPTVNVNGVDVNFEDHFAWRLDIGIQYDAAGFQMEHFKGAVDQLIQDARPIRIDDTYDATSGTYAYYIPIPLGATEMQSGSRFRLDMLMDTRSPWPPYEDLMNQVPTVRPTRMSNGEYHPLEWSFGPKTVAGGYPVDFPGVPHGVKNDADNKFWMLPINPYIAIYRKDQFVWGYSPSYEEQSQKLAHYEMDVQLESPWNVPNGTYVEIDRASSTFYVDGQVSITEAGWITDIWVNGEQLEDIYETGIVTRDNTTGNFDVSIPVKMRIGGNEVDITIFAGPDPSCEECQTSGGCAFENRNYFVQFSKGDLTASSIKINQADGSLIPSPVDLESVGSVDFNITVTDMDKRGTNKLLVWVINARKGDTLQVELQETSTQGTFSTSSPITATPKDAASTGSSEISFFGGDTVYVRYVDEVDPEDISEALFFAEKTYPVPVSATVLDMECIGRATHIRVDFSGSFESGDRMDTVWVSMSDPAGFAADSFYIMVDEEIAGKNSLTLPLPTRSGIPKTTGPVGYITAYIQPKGEPRSQGETVPTLTDGIPPVMIGFSLLENKAPRIPEDTMMVGFSERVQLTPATAWPFAIADGDTNSIDASVLTMLGEATTENEGKSWLFAVSGNTDGSVLADGNLAFVNDGVTISDRQGNRLTTTSTCSDWVEIVEVPKPVPIRVARIIDGDGDAYPDSIVMEFERRVTFDLDSFWVNWAVPSQERSFLPPFFSHEYTTSSRTVAIDSVTTEEVIDTASIITLAVEAGKFREPATVGYANGRGHVIPRLGPEGGFFDKDYPLVDVVGPRIVEARLNEDGTILDVEFSEPLDTVYAGLNTLEKKRDPVVQLAPDPFGPAAGGNWDFYFLGDESVQANTVKVGDLIRISPDQPVFLDKAGNTPGEINPWVEIRGSLKDNVTIESQMMQDVSQANLEQIADGYAADSTAGAMRVTFVNPLDGSERRVAAGSGIVPFEENGMILDSLDWYHAGPTFEVKLAIPGAKFQKSGQNVWDYDLQYEVIIYDALGQFANNIGFSTSLSPEIRNNYVDADGVITMRVEWMLQGSGNTWAPVAKGGRKVGSGAYIGAHQFKTRAEFLYDAFSEENQDKDNEDVEYLLGEIIRSDVSTVNKFGFLRP